MLFVLRFVNHAAIWWFYLVFWIMGKYSPFCLLVREFYPFVGIDSVGDINSDERIKFYIVMFVDEKLYHLKKKFYHTNGSVKQKYFFHWRDIFIFYDVIKWFRLRENCFTLMENCIPQTDPLKWKISSIEGILSCLKVIPIKGKLFPLNGK